MAQNAHANIIQLLRMALRQYTIRRANVEITIQLCSYRTMFECLRAQIFDKQPAKYFFFAHSKAQQH